MSDHSSETLSQRCLRKFIVVTDEMVEAALSAQHGCLDVHDLGDPYYRDLWRDIMRTALEAALKVDED